MGCKDIGQKTKKYVKKKQWLNSRFQNTTIIKDQKGSEQNNEDIIEVVERVRLAGQPFYVSSL